MSLEKLQVIDCDCEMNRSEVFNGLQFQEEGIRDDNIGPEPGKPGKVSLQSKADPSGKQGSREKLDDRRLRMALPRFEGKGKTARNAQDEGNLREVVLVAGPIPGRTDSKTTRLGR